MKTKAMTFGAICIILNIVLAKVSDILTLKVLFLDTIGTILAAVAMGPLGGAAVGGSTNLVLGIISGVDNIPFAIVNIAVGLFIGFVARDGKFTIKKAFISGLVLAVLVPLIGTPISILVYGGISGSGLDILYGFLRQAGESMFTSAFIPRIMSNIIDKPVSAIIAAIAISKLPAQMLIQIRPTKHLKKVS